ncbi:SRPBCC domain-containing protein [Streptomyces carpaticus]|uniref:SRPBCC domain-containing protein n=1 Tax=Streptomyces carpaticus TaxID=285558 RepID=A0ABV4ZU80_9ACTN
MTHEHDSADRAPDPLDRRGTMGMSRDGSWQIRFERRLRHSPRRVWEALADARQRSLWLPGAELHTEPGGRARFDFGEEGAAEGEVLRAEAPHLLEHTWLWPGEPSSVVRWEITPHEEGTAVVLLHRALRPEPAAQYRAGWHHILDSLDTHLDGSREHGAGCKSAVSS